MLKKIALKQNWLDYCGWSILAGLLISLSIGAVDRHQAVQPQVLPVTAQFSASGETIELEVASTSQQQGIGLMYRELLEGNRGMLFPVNPPQKVQTWMRNTLIDLDILFLRNGEIVSIALAAPCYVERCPLYTSKVPVDQVIELKGGRAAELGLKVGDSLLTKPVLKP